MSCSWNSRIASPIILIAITNSKRRGHDEHRRAAASRVATRIDDEEQDDQPDSAPAASPANNAGDQPPDELASA